MLSLSLGACAVSPKISLSSAVSSHGVPEAGQCDNASPASDLHYSPVEMTFGADQAALRSDIQRYMMRYAHALGCELEKQYGGRWRLDAAGSAEEHENMRQLQTAFAAAAADGNPYPYTEHQMTFLSSDGKLSEVLVSIGMIHDAAKAGENGTFQVSKTDHMRLAK